MVNRNPFIDPIEAPDLATKLVAKDGTDDAGYITIADLREVVHVDDYGAVGDGVTNDTAAFTAAFTALGGAGEVYIGRNHYLIDTALVVPAGCCIVGPYGAVPLSGVGYAFNWDGFTSRIYVNSAVTITLESGAGIRNCVVVRKGLAMPAEDPDDFAGTGITFNSDTAGHFVRDCFIGGFAVGIQANELGSSGGQGRFFIQDCLMDNLNCIYTDTLTDSARITNVHGWPFLTIEAYVNGGAVDEALRMRLGSGLKVRNSADGLEIDGVLMFGYTYNFDFDDCGGVSIARIWSDHPFDQSGTRGVSFGANTTNMHIGTCITWGAEQGIVCEMNTTESLTIGMLFSVSNATAINLTGGTLIIGEWKAKSCTSALLIQQDGRIRCSSTFFEDIANDQPVAVGTGVYINDLDLGRLIWDDTAGSSLISTNLTTAPQIASVSFIVLPTNANFFEITGTTTIDVIAGAWPGRRVLFYFSGVLTVTDGGGSNLRLAGNLTTTAGTTLELIGLDNGGTWLEVGRSVN